MFLNVFISEWVTLSLNSGCGFAFGAHLLLIGKWNAEVTLKADHSPCRKVTIPNLKAILDIIALYIGRTTMLRKHSCLNTYKPSTWSVRPYAQVGAFAKYS